MENIMHKTARYKIIADSGGNRYRFFCDLSGMAVCTTRPIRADTPEEELLLAWESEGKAHFNVCKHCGSFVADVMWNADLLHCVKCTPWEDQPSFCPYCGEKVINTADDYCRRCGKKLFYERGDVG